MSDPIRRLVEEFSKLPGIGEKSATRLVYHLVQRPKRELQDFARALVDVSENVQLCPLCMDISSSDGPCPRCSDHNRGDSIICVVSSPTDVAAIDRGAVYSGRFHVLHGVLSPLDGVGPDDIRIKELLERIQKAEKPIREVILATAATVEGEATAMYLAKLLKPLGVKASRIASGIPVGGELEYTDRATIARALDGRVEV